MKKILIVEGNLREENQNFSTSGIQTHTQSLQDTLANFTNELDMDVVNPSSDEDIDKNVKELNKYDGLIWGGSSLNIYNDTPEIRRQIQFMKECQKKVKNILAICWGMQVAVTAAGGVVKKSSNGAHIGIANQLVINEQGLKHPLYSGKKNNFNTPAFNFDEVATLPENGVCLASNKINKVQSMYFKINNNNIWGLQYHPEITYQKMIQLIKFRKDRLIETRKVFANHDQVDEHISFIEKEISISDNQQRMIELKNWLNSF
ncbi:type 1 glutamine amidotransferase [Candidatus Pelagibacter sp.]|jgi:GMP synthase (glutamine-hydrolysing)|nr:type 1 glutamine amidotransferase [Candidatus Pelagibacter sp.]